MTIGDYIKEKLSIWSVAYSTDMIELELAKIGHSSVETITEETKLDLFFYNVIPEIMAMPSNISEGGFSISYDKASMTAFYSMLAKRLGKKDVLSANSITDITNRW